VTAGHNSTKETYMLFTIQNALRRRFDDEGATAVEYGIMVALIAVVIIFAVWFIGEQLDSTFSCVGESISNADGSPDC
jgi:pilus assembly protein Flp/PilA